MSFRDLYRLVSLLTPLESRVSSDLGASPVWDKLSLKAFMFPSRTGQVSYQLQLGHSLHRSNIILKALKQVRLTAIESDGAGVVILCPYHMGLFRKKALP